MSCKSKEALVAAAVCTLIKEIVSAYEARRRARREAIQAEAAAGRATTVEAMP